MCATQANARARPQPPSPQPQVPPLGSPAGSTAPGTPQAQRVSGHRIAITDQRSKAVTSQPESVLPFAGAVLKANIALSQ